MGAVNSSTSNSVASYGLYQLPYTSSAINVNTDNLKKCMSQTENINGLRTCIQNNVSSAIPKNNMTVSGNNLNVKYYGPGETVMTNITTVTESQSSSNPGKVISQNTTKNIQQAPGYPFSHCYEGFDSDNDNDDTDTGLESNKIFCFNGTFTLLAIFVLVLLLIFINVNSKSDKAVNNILLK